MDVFGTYRNSAERNTHLLSIMEIYKNPVFLYLRNCDGHMVNTRMFLKRGDKYPNAFWDSVMSNHHASSMPCDTILNWIDIAEIVVKYQGKNPNDGYEIFVYDSPSNLARVLGNNTLLDVPWEI